MPRADVRQVEELAQLRRADFDFDPDFHDRSNDEKQENGVRYAFRSKTVSDPVFLTPFFSVFLVFLDEGDRLVGTRLHDAAEADDALAA
ncbi:MAG TPA: hypothetical protein VMQ83_10430, partial [Gammaproteobacteria bacterium]|nr:hypothetical protein [Gammaproteobacteria bacterium]